jgi:D123
MSTLKAKSKTSSKILSHFSRRKSRKSSRLKTVSNIIISIDRIYYLDFLDCFDVIRSTKDHVTLVDFSPFNEAYSCSLAFEWNEEQDDPEFRYLANDVGIQPTSRNNYGIPQDVINMFKASASTENEELDEQQLTNINRLVINQMEDELRSQDD